MSVKFILGQVGVKSGLNPNAASSRGTLLRWLNEASRELYDQSDPPGSLVEQAFRVNGDQTISCPATVGPIRGARELDTHIAWSITKMRPRYAQFNWSNEWRSLRVLNTRALMATVTNTACGVVTVPAVEDPPVQVTVTGPTEYASSISETVVMSSTSVNTVNDFLDYTSVKKDRVNNYDVTLSDVDGKVLTVIPNNLLAAQYQILDVSMCPWLTTTQNPLDHYVEILYKQANTQLVNDADEFIFGQKYDDILVNKCIQLWYEEQGKGDLASAFDAKATRSLARKSEDQNRATEDVVSFVNNPHDSLLERVRSGRRRYYRNFRTRGYN